MMTLKAIRAHYQSRPKFSGSITAAMRKRAARAANQPLPPAKSGRFAERHAANLARRANPVVVPLGDCARACLDKIKDNNRRLKEWPLGAEAAVLTTPYQFRESGSPGYVGRRSTFQRGAWVQSCATCTRTTATLRLFGDTHTIDAPRGYRWEIDANGLCLIGAAGEYHPTASELLEGGKAIVELLKQAAETRKLAKAKAKQQLGMVKLAEREGATVCLADSLRAGNCSAGSQSWARSHGLDPRKHYTPSQILAKANGDASRVAIVVAAAIRRHRVEMSRGYAVLAEHRAN